MRHSLSHSAQGHAWDEGKLIPLLSLIFLRDSALTLDLCQSGVTGAAVNSRQACVEIRIRAIKPFRRMASGLSDANDLAETEACSQGYTN